MARKKIKKGFEELPSALDWTEIKKDSRVHIIETYDADTKDREGIILLKEGNREGLTGIVKIIENIEIELDYSGDIKSLNGRGTLIVGNPSSNDRLWDIDVSFKNIKGTDLQ